MSTPSHLNSHPLKPNRNGSSNPPPHTELPLRRLTSLQEATRKITLLFKRPLLLLALSNHIRYPSTHLHKCNMSSTRHLRLNNNTKTDAHTTLLLALLTHRFLTRTHSRTRTRTRTIKARTPPHPQSSSNPVGGPYIHPSGLQGYITSSRIKAIGTSRTRVPLELYGRYYMRYATP